jgi:hypothetical protein
MIKNRSNNLFGTKHFVMHIRHYLENKLDRIKFGGNKNPKLSFGGEHVSSIISRRGRRA